MNPLETQVGDSHYKGLAIQPAEYCQRNRLPYCESAVIRYVTRHRLKNGREDIEKAIHCLHLLLEMEYPQRIPTAEGEPSVTETAYQKAIRETGENVAKAMNSDAYDAIMHPGTVAVKWRCPICGRKHVWQWGRWEILDGACEMECDSCGEKTDMIGDGTGAYSKRKK
jgi:predicted RNA-binding Zn-ribbon protein involved in translation (DUF1610 family)